MGTKYTGQSSSGYNASPPADDGSEVESNKTKWQDHVIDKVGDPLKTFIESVDSTLTSHFDEGPITKSANFTTTAAEYRQTIQVTGGATLSLGAPVTMGEGYMVRVKNTDTSDVTVDVDGGGTIDGASSFTLAENDAAIFIVDDGAGEYALVSMYRDFLSGSNLNADVDAASINNIGGLSVDLGTQDQTLVTTDDVTFNSVTATIAASNVTEISNLTAAEGEQLENIGTTTISGTQWGYLGATDQGVATTDDVTFNSITGTVAASNVTEISNLTAAEGAQLENIGTTTITGTQWGYLGATDQGLSTTDDVTFNSVTGTIAVSDVTELSNLTAAEGAQLENIDSTTISATQWGILGGLTADASELNTLDGITASTTELNLIDGYTGSTADLNRIDGAAAVTKENAFVPAGMVMGWTTNTAPTGWLECDGSAVNRTTYAELFSAIGVIYGNGNGSTTFNLPDYRGEFLRGYDNTAGNDPDAGSRTDRGDSTTGDNVGTKQDFALEDFSGSFRTPPYTVGGQLIDSESGVFSDGGTSGTRNDIESGGTGSSPAQLVDFDASGSATTSTETRPRNVYIMWVIKT